MIYGSKIQDIENKVSFAIGTGRCGTHFLAEVIKMEPGVSSVHERNPLNETFHRYCKWYKLPVDDEGFLCTKETEIRRDLTNYNFSFEASAYLSLSVQELYERFKAKFIFLIRTPERVVNSYLYKGTYKNVIKWYEKPFVKNDLRLALGYQESTHFHHFLGRLAPSGDEFRSWNELSRVGKLGWYWNALNAAILDQLGHIPQTHWQIQKLEDLNYERYLEIASFLGFDSVITRTTFEKVVEARPTAQLNIPTVASWSTAEVTEFEEQVKPMAKHFGYEYRINNLLKYTTEADSNSREHKVDFFRYLKFW